MLSVIINKKNEEQTLRNYGDLAKEEEKWESLDWVIKSREMPVPG